MFYALLILAFGYGLACLWLVKRWQAIYRRPQSAVAIPADLQLSVIIPVRNEALHIADLLADLLAQTLPKNQFEVIVANDASTDDTALIVKQFQENNALNLTLISLPDAPVAAPKKRAIAEAIRVANGALIVTTDGDCRATPEWLKTIAQTYLETNAKFISGPVTFFTQNSNLFDVFQTIEFASLIGTGACLVEAGYPTMCNGANLAFERAAFEAVGGYAGTDHIASGDDELLMHKMALKYPQQIVFVKNPATIIQTAPQASWGAFYQQRLRWGSKWAANRRVATMGVALFVFLANLALIVAGVAFTWGQLSAGEFWAILILKMTPEFLFLSLVIRFLGKKQLIYSIVFVQFFYPFYVLFFGLAAQQKTYTWKGRRLK